MALWKAVTIFLSFLSTVFGITDPSMLDALSALERVIYYYKTNYQVVNLDGVFGLKIVEGQLSSILEDYNDGHLPHLNQELVSRIKKIKHEAEDSSIGAIPFLKKSEPEYYKQMHFLMESPWDAWKSPSKLDHSLKWEKGAYDKIVRDIDEKTSDRCIVELYTGRKKSCQLSSSCLAIMIGIRGLTDYAITHQLLYTQMAEQVGCAPRLNLWLEEHKRPGGIPQMQREFCSNIHNSMSEKLMLTNGIVLPYYQDLLMEEVFVCGSLGFRELFQTSLFEQIISWQKMPGCYGTMPRPILPNISHFQHYDYEDEDDVNMQQKIADVYHPPKKQDIHKLKKRDSPYELFKIAHAPAAKGPGTHKPVAVVLNRNNMKVVDDQLVQDTGSPPRNMQMNSNIHPDAQRAQLQKPPSPNRVSENDQRFRQIERPVPKINGNAVEKAVLDGNLVDSKLHGKLSGHRTGSQQNVDHGEDAYQEGEQEDDDEDDDDLDLRGQILNVRRRKLLYEKSLAGGCLSHKTAVAAGSLASFIHHLVEMDGDWAVTKQPKKGTSGGIRAQLQQPKQQHQREILRDRIKTKRKQRVVSGKISKHVVVLGKVSKQGVSPGKITKKGAALGKSSLRKVISSKAETGKVKVGGQGKKEIKARRGDQDIGQDYAEENDDYQGYANHEEESQDHYNDDQNQQGKVFIGQKSPIKKNGLDKDNEHYDEEQYDRYYYDTAEEGKKNTVDKNKDILIVENTKQEQNPNLNPHKTFEPVLNQNNIPTTHLFVFSLITLVLLYFMYRFIRKRRLLIRYPFSGR